MAAPKNKGRGLKAKNRGTGKSGKRPERIARSVEPEDDRWGDSGPGTDKLIRSLSGRGSKAGRPEL